MAIITTHESLSVLEVPQQFLAGESIGPDVEYKLGRACTAHCTAAVQEIMEDPDSPSVGELIAFVMKNGAETDSSLYHDGAGWNIIGLADLMRLKGYPVVSQNLRYGPEHLDIASATAAGRVRNDYEQSTMLLRSIYGGSDRQRWTQALQETLAFGGAVVCSIQIPLLSGDGYGMHAVAVTEIDEDTGAITYFDPDYYNTKRYGSSPPVITRIDDNKLMYQRSLDDHLSVMTGEVMHVFPRRNG